MSVNQGVRKTSVAVQCLEWFCAQCEAGPTKVVYAREVAAIIAYMLDHLQGIAALAYDSRFMPQKYQDVDKLVALLKQLASPMPVLDNNKFELPHDEHGKRLLNTLSSQPSFPSLPSSPSSNLHSNPTGGLADGLAGRAELVEPLGLPDFCRLAPPNNRTHLTHAGHHAGHHTGHHVGQQHAGQQFEHQFGHQFGHHAGHQIGHHAGHYADVSNIEPVPRISQPDYFEDYLPTGPTGPNGLDGYVDEDVQEADQEAEQETDQEAGQDDSNIDGRPHINVARRSLPDLVETDATGKALWYLSFFKIPRGCTQLTKELCNLIACINIWWAKKQASSRQASSRQFAMFIHRVEGNPVYVAIKATSTERDFPRIELAKFLRDFYDIDLEWVNDDEHSSYGRSVVPYANNKSKDNFPEDTTKKILTNALGGRSSMGCMIFPTESELVVGAPSQKVCDDIVKCINEFMARRGLPPKRKSAQNKTGNKLSRSRN